LNKLNDLSTNFVVEISRVQKEINIIQAKEGTEKEAQKPTNAARRFKNFGDQPDTQDTSNDELSSLLSYQNELYSELFAFQNCVNDAAMRLHTRAANHLMSVDLVKSELLMWGSLDHMK